MRNVGIPALAGVLLLIMLVGCGSNGNVVNKTYQAECWPVEDTLTGTFEVNSTSDKFLLYFPVTVTDDYPYYNLFLRTQITSPSGKSGPPEQFEFRLVGPEGNWMNMSTDKKTQFNLEWDTGRMFLETGTYTVQLYHFMRDQPLCGVREVGVEIQANPGE